MGTNRRYGSPAERAERKRQRDALLTPQGRRRLRHCWVDTASSFDNNDPAPGVVVEWAATATCGTPASSTSKAPTP